MCLAQERQEAEQPATTAEPATDTEVPRSAFGKVMSLLISALQHSADAATSGTAKMDFQPATTAPTARDIQVSAAFHLDPAAESAPERAATASID